MRWPDITADLDTYLADIPDPTDADLRAIEADPGELIPDDEFLEWLAVMMEDDDSE